MDERPTVDVILPISHAKVTLYTFLRNGDFRLIQRRLADTIKFKVQRPNDGEKPVTPELSGGAAILEQDFTLELLTKEVIDANGNKVENISSFYYNLQISDGEALYVKVNELTTDSTLSSERKKK